MNHGRPAPAGTRPSGGAPVPEPPAALDAVEAPIRQSPSAYAEQLRGGFRWLAFSEPLEQQFREAHMRRLMPRLRFNLLFGMLIFSSFALIDVILMPPVAVRWSLGVRGLFAGPVIVATLALTYRRLPPHVMTVAIMACMMVASWSITVIAGVVAVHATPIHFASLGLMAMFIYFMSGLLFFDAMVCGVQLIAAFCIVALLAGLPIEPMIYHGSFLFIANAFGMVGCYTLEMANRSNFLRTGILNDLADRDGLTGLRNRRSFERKAALALAQAVRERVPVAVMMLDIDRFKAYNDIYGHLAGDRSLSRVAAVLQDHARRPLDVVARYGGEEFVLLWYGVEWNTVHALAERLRAAIVALDIPHSGSEDAGVVTVSSGIVVTVPRAGRGLDDLLRQADEALYEAKRGGRNRFKIVNAAKTVIPDTATQRTGGRHER